MVIYDDAYFVKEEAARKAFMRKSLEKKLEIDQMKKLIRQDLMCIESS
jgi:hypothetical protein